MLADVSPYFGDLEFRRTLAEVSPYVDWWSLLTQVGETQNLSRAEREPD